MSEFATFAFAGPVTVATCRWCRRTLEVASRITCTNACRKLASKARRYFRAAGGSAAAVSPVPGRFDLVDPPYPGMAARYYANEPEYSGDVDSFALLSLLEQRRRKGTTIGYVLATSPEALEPSLKSLGDAGPGRRVGVWRKPGRMNSQKRGWRRSWEPVIFATNRVPETPVDLFLSAPPARGDYCLPRAHLMGRKPPIYTAWVLALLGAAAGDTVVDWFPGSGLMTAVARAVLSLPITAEWNLPRGYGITPGSCGLVSLGAGAERRRTLNGSH